MENNKSPYLCISKEHLAELPLANYNGRVCVVDKDYQIEKAVSDIMQYKMIGFDTETRPSFKKGIVNQVALLQLATPDCCYLFRLNLLKNIEKVISIMEDASILKIGLSIHDDFHTMRKLVDFHPQSFIDIQSYIKNFKITDNSLAKIYGILFGKRISKSQRLTNWEADFLTVAQQNYAALDALACLEIYQYLESGVFEPMLSPYLTYPTEENILSCGSTQVESDITQ